MRLPVNDNLSHNSQTAAGLQQLGPRAARHHLGPSHPRRRDTVCLQSRGTICPSVQTTRVTVHKVIIAYPSSPSSCCSLCWSWPPSRQLPGGRSHQPCWWKPQTQRLWLCSSRTQRCCCAAGKPAVGMRSWCQEAGATSPHQLCHSDVRRLLGVQGQVTDACDMVRGLCMSTLTHPEGGGKRWERAGVRAGEHLSMPAASYPAPARHTGALPVFMWSVHVDLPLLASIGEGSPIWTHPRLPLSVDSCSVWPACVIELREVKLL